MASHAAGNFHAAMLYNIGPDGCPDLTPGNALAIPGQLIQDLTATYNLNETEVSGGCVSYSSIDPDMSVDMSFCELVIDDLVDFFDIGQSLVDTGGTVTGDPLETVGHIGPLVGSAAQCCPTQIGTAGKGLVVWRCVQQCDGSGIVGTDGSTPVWQVDVLPLIKSVLPSTLPFGGTRDAFSNWGVTFELGNGQLGQGCYSAFELALADGSADLAVDSVTSTYLSGLTTVQPPFGDLCDCSAGGGLEGYQTDPLLVPLAA